MKTLEITGFLFGIAGVFLTIRRQIFCFPVGLVNVSITAWLVFHQQLYADVLQQLVYFILLVYGWVQWAKGNSTADHTVTASSPITLIYLGILIMFSSAALGYLLRTYSNASYPYLDSTGTIICFTAQWLIAGKKIENWYLWVVANLMYIILYLLKDLPWYSLLSAVYLVMAVFGWREWKKRMTGLAHD